MPPRLVVGYYKDSTQAHAAASPCGLCRACWGRRPLARSCLPSRTHGTRRQPVRSAAHARTQGLRPAREQAACIIHSRGLVTAGFRDACARLWHACRGLAGQIVHPVWQARPPGPWSPPAECCSQKRAPSPQSGHAPAPLVRRSAAGGARACPRHAACCVRAASAACCSGPSGCCGGGCEPGAGAAPAAPPAPGMSSVTCSTPTAPPSRGGGAGAASAWLGDGPPRTSAAACGVSVICTCWAGGLTKLRCTAQRGGGGRGQSVD